MARTKDPSAATRKAWITRKRGSAAERVDRLRGRPGQAEYLGGGVSQTFKVTLEDGTECNFKLDDDDSGPEREVATWEIAQIVGMDDMVPPAVIREIDLGSLGAKDFMGFPMTAGRHRGSLAEWRPGQVAEGLAERGQGRYGSSEHDVMRAAMFDYVVGNTDRHPGNWVLDDGKIGLIDHNLTLGPDGYVYSAFLSKINKTGSMARRDVALFVKPYLDKKYAIIMAMAIPTLNRRNERALAMEERIDRAASAETWRDLLDVIGYKPPETFDPATPDEWGWSGGDDDG